MTRPRLLPGRLVILLAGLIVALSAMEPRFYSLDNFVNILVQISIDGILACGMTLAVLTGGLDLSIGSVAALSGVLFVLVSSEAVGLAGFVALGAGVAVGFVNGWLIARLRLNPLIVTLGAMAALQGIALWLSRGYPLPGPGGQFETLGGGFFCHIPLPIVLFGLTAGAAQLLLSYSQFGRDVYALGGNREAARVGEVPVAGREWSVYVISAALAAFAGMILASRLNTGSPIIGQDAPLQALVAVVLGGTSLSGGKGGVRQTVLGLIVLGVLSNGLNLLNVGPAFQWGIKGSVLIVFAALDNARFSPGAAAHLIVKEAS